MKEFITEEFIDEANNKNELKNLLFAYLIHWKWFILSVVICLATAWVYLRYATPVFNVSATVMIKDDKKGGRNNDMLALEDMGFLSSGGSIDNEIEILRSKSLIKQAVILLETYASYTTKGHIGSRDLYNESPIRLEMLPEDLEKLTTAFGFEVTMQANHTWNITGNIGGKDITCHINHLPNILYTPVGTITLSHRSDTQPISDPIYINVTPPIQVAKKYLAALSITSTNTTTSIATISMQTTNRQRGEDFINTLIEVYNTDANNDKNIVATRTARFIDDRIDIINRELGSTEAELESFKRGAGLTNISDAQTYVQESAEYEKKRMDIGTQLNLMTYLKDYINNRTNADAVIPANVGVNDESLSALINKYNEQVLERNRLLRTSSDTNPVIINLNNNLAAMSNNIKLTINSVHKGLTIAQQDIDRQATKYTSRISNAPTQERALTSISRQQEIKAGLYLMLLQKREENSIALAATADNAKIIDAALTDDSPIAPNYSLIRIIAFTIGLLIPIIVITLINFFRVRIEGHADVEKLTRVPILGDVPLDHDIKKGALTAISVRENENNLMSEVFRGIRTNLQFVLNRPCHQVILVTSTTSGEGKTFVSSNLSISLALLGKRVVIVGLDVRKPRLLETFGYTPTSQGITNFLVDDSIDIHSLLVPNEASKNLWVLPSGAIPPNPAELLARPALEQAIEILKKEFDYVILDTAPVGLVTDTLILSRVADASIYICRADYSYKNDFDLINELHQNQKLPQLSLIINGVNMKKKKYGHYRYNSGYGYGYGYGPKNRHRK